MKAIMISIKPKWCAKIMNGEKTIELRKTMPKCDLPIDVYIYCTKEKWKTKPLLSGDIVIKPNADPLNKHNVRLLNGKVVAKFTLNKVNKHHILPTERILPFNWNVEQKLKQLCLTKEEVMAYGNGEDYQAFLWHISNLEIFDKPKELSEFKHTTHYRRYGSFRVEIEEQIVPLTKAPQNYCYIEGEIK